MILIREIESQDLPQLLKLCELHAQFEGADYDYTGKQEKLERALFADCPAVFGFVALQGATIVGYTTVTKEFSTWDADYFLHMDCLFILETHRGEGLGRRFLDRLKGFAQQHACTHIQWQTPEDNANAIAFYQKQGAQSKNKKRFYLSV